MYIFLTKKTGIMQYNWNPVEFLVIRKYTCPEIRYKKINKEADIFRGFPQSPEVNDSIPIIYSSYRLIELLTPLLTYKTT
jgi:hypothetical protein